MRRHALVLSLALGAGLFAGVGCKPSLLPNTTIEDTAENRAIADFVLQYKRAVEARSPEQVLSLVAEDYFEDMGTVDPKDDYGVEKLEERLAETFAHSKAIHLEMFLQNVARDEKKELFAVDYRYNQRALLSFEAGDQWITNTDVNRLVLRQRGDDIDDGFVIVSGL